MAKKQAPNLRRITDPQRDPGNLVDNLRRMVECCQNGSLVQGQILQDAKLDSKTLVSVYPDESE